MGINAGAENRKVGGRILRILMKLLLGDRKSVV